MSPTGMGNRDYRGPRIVIADSFGAAEPVGL
jgi:hypothetical protein